MAKPVRRVVLGITGSIAAYKAPHLVRGLIKKGVEVRCVLTPTAAQFVSPLTLTTLSKHPIAQAMSDPALWELVKDDPITMLLLSGEASTVHEAETKFLNENVETISREVVELVESDLTNRHYRK